MEILLTFPLHQELLFLPENENYIKNNFNYFTIVYVAVIFLVQGLLKHQILPELHFQPATTTDILISNFQNSLADKNVVNYLICLV